MTMKMTIKAFREVIERACKNNNFCLPNGRKFAQTRKQGLRIKYTTGRRITRDEYNQLSEILTKEFPEQSFAIYHTDYCTTTPPTHHYAGSCPGWTIYVADKGNPIPDNVDSSHKRQLAALDSTPPKAPGAGPDKQPAGMVLSVDEIALINKLRADRNKMNRMQHVTQTCADVFSATTTAHMENDMVVLANQWAAVGVEL